MCDFGFSHDLRNILWCFCGCERFDLRPISKLVGARIQTFVSWVSNAGTVVQIREPRSFVCIKLSTRTEMKLKFVQFAPGI